MDERAFSAAVAALDGEHSLAILRYLASGEWRIATEVSRALRIHTTTAQTFLAAMHHLGFLERRARRSRARTAMEYRLSSARIALELDLVPGTAPLSKARAFYEDYAARVVARARRLGWPGIDRRMEALLASDGEGPNTVDELRARFRDVHASLLATATEAIGPGAAARLLRGAADEAAAGRELFVKRHRLLDALEA